MDDRLIDYVTPDLGKAATVIVMSGTQPDEFVRLDTQRPQIVFKWNHVPEAIIREMNKKRLRVEPLCLIEAYRELKTKTLKILDEDKNEINRTAKE